VTVHRQVDRELNPGALQALLLGRCSPGDAQDPRRRTPPGCWSGSGR